jgi:hypothetical protein
MPVMLERWNDDKMDALAAEVALTREQLGEHRKETREDLRDLRREMHQMQRVMTQAAIGLFGAIVLGFVTVLAAVL